MPVEREGVHLDAQQNDDILILRDVEKTVYGRDYMVERRKKVSYIGSLDRGWSKLVSKNATRDIIF